MWPAAVGSVVVAVACYFAFESSLPKCGPPGNTFLGEIYWLVPLVLLAAQGAVIALVCRKMGRSPMAIVVIALVAAVVACVLGAAIWIGFFVAGNCGE